MDDKQPTTLSGTHVGIEDDKRTSVEARHGAVPEKTPTAIEPEPEQPKQEPTDAPPPEDQIESD